MKRLQKIIRKKGRDSQIVKAAEECSELSAILLKSFCRHASVNKIDIVSEMADVLIMINQLRIIYEVPDREIELIMNDKLERTLMRIKKEESRE